MKHLLIAVCLLLAADVATAATSPGQQLRSAVNISVHASADAGVFEVKAVVTDLADDAVIASPMLLVRDGEEGSVRIDRGDQGNLLLAVRVDAGERSLRYRSELRVNAELVSRQSAQIALP